VTRDESVIEFGGFRLNTAERSLVAAEGAPIQLTRRLYDTLVFMVERPGRLLEKQALLDAVWKGAVVEENTLSRTISALREILGERGGEHRYIATVSGIGYRFIAPVTVTAQRPPAPQPQRAEPVLAVLPFEDLSRERDQAYFADGVAEDVLNRLTSVKGLRLIAKSSSFGFRDRAEGVQGIARKLGVDYLLVGAVRKEGARLRVTAQLIEVATDSQRWSDAFDRELELAHVFEIQDDIARSVAGALSANLGVRAEPAKRSTSDFEAYDLFLRGRANIDQSGAPANIRAVELLRAAVTRDPHFAEAWHGLAIANFGLLIFAPERAAHAREEIEEAAERTLELAPRWWAVHMLQCLRSQLRRDWLGFERSVALALELAPDKPWPLDQTLGILRGQANDSAAAIEHLRTAMRSDPLSRLVSSLYQMHLSIAGRNDEAETEYRRSLDLAGDPEMVEHLVLHRLWARGAPFDDEFRTQFRRYLDLTRTKPAPVLEDVYAVFDAPHLALDKLRAAAAAPEYQNPLRQLVLGWWLAAYGDVDGSFATLWRSYVDMQHFNVSWLWFPVLRRVREHARFPELLEHVGLAAYWRAKKSARA
jgi:TolB-like protein